MMVPGGPAPNGSRVPYLTSRSMPYGVWLVIGAIKWSAIVFAAVVAVRIATELASAWRPVAAVAWTRRRWRDGRWWFGWLMLLAVSLPIVHCQVGDFYSFQDPSGGDWNIDTHGWPLVEPHSLTEAAGNSTTLKAIYGIAIAFDLLFSLVLLAATRLMADRWIAAWDAPARWPTLGREAAGWCAALVAILLCERLAVRPLILPGTEMIVYSTLVYESPEVHAGMLIGLASLAYLLGRRVIDGARTLKRLHAEGVI